MAIAKLKGKIQDYGWGGLEYIPTLLHIENTDLHPFAELWMGTHHKGCSEILVEGKWQSLEHYIMQNPQSVLGKKTADKFNNKLPYLFKILDVKKTLSIQSHPTKKAAEIGFRRENELGIPLTANHRNYRDDNHKPEVMVALTDFWLLHGFKPQSSLSLILDTIVEFAPLKSHFELKDIKVLYEVVMTMEQTKVNTILQPLKDRLMPLYHDNLLSKTSEDYWAARAFDTNILGNGNLDRGIFSIYFLNLVFLKKDQGIYQAAGIPHAYLEGVNTELMANSDNVFRGGLTYKHIDVNELMQHLVFDSVVPNILEGVKRSSIEWVYKTPAPDFELSKIIIDTDVCYHYQSESPEILILIEGEAIIKDKQQKIACKKGDIIFATANKKYEITGINKAIWYKANVPTH